LGIHCALDPSQAQDDVLFGASLFCGREFAAMMFRIWLTKFAGGF